jgi:nitrogen fixation NifU-like protein
MAGLEDLYREEILDHYRHPRNRGTLEPADISYSDSNPLCGDELRMDLRLAGDRVSEVRFSGHGCAISQASASMLSELMEGKTLEELKSIAREDIVEMLGIPISPVRLKCALLSLKCLKAGAYGLAGWPGEDGDGTPQGGSAP